MATALRKTAEDILKREIKKSSFAELMQEVVSHKLQSNLKRQLAKVYPLKVCEIRCLIIEKSKRAFEEEKPPLKVKEVETEEKKEIKTPEAEKPSKKEPEKKEEKTEIKAEEKKE